MFLNTKAFNLYQKPVNVNLFVGLRSLATQANLKENKKSSDWEHAKQYEDIPGPSMYELIKGYIPGGEYYGIEDRTNLYKKCIKKYGDVFRIPGTFGQNEYVFVNRPEHIETVYRTEGVWPIRKGLDTLIHYRTEYNSEPFKDCGSLLSGNGDVWAKFRTNVNPIMMQPKTVGMYIPRMNQVADDFIERIKTIRNSETNEVPGTFQRDINSWTLESIALVALDTRLGIIQNIDNNPDGKIILESLDQAFELPQYLDFKPSIWKYYGTKKFKQLMKAHDNLTRMSQKYIRQALDRVKDKKSTDEEYGESIIERLAKIDEKIAIVMALEMFFAGTDTTTTAFSSCLLALSKNPTKQAILRQEIMKMLPDKETPITKENLSTMPYLRAVIKESIRLYPVVLEIYRQTTNDVLLDGYQIPKGKNIGMLYPMLYRSKEQFYEPDKFMPERWLRDQSQIEESEKCPVDSKKSTNPFTYIPFGHGPRICIGKRMVEMEMEVSLSKIIRNFHVEYNYPEEDFFKLGLIYTPKAELKFKFTDI